MQPVDLVFKLLLSFKIAVERSSLSVKAAYISIFLEMKAGKEISRMEDNFINLIIWKISLMMPL
ncbi:hypothetical protein DI53_0018 [Sphingobacterium deserti]|uniref:Uncharacterized protein n=1 Tax=Sphingobacterium deserti TaxID=1229276 RepID=A0A0B8TCU0_9SPHI|nr:hypothetical protein DI53_0018 [Sphingobacterium deserti]